MLGLYRPVADFLDETAMQGLKQIHQQVSVWVLTRALRTLLALGEGWVSCPGSSLLRLSPGAVGSIRWAALAAPLRPPRAYVGQEGRAPLMW